MDPSTGSRDATPAGVAAARAFMEHRFPSLAGAPLLGSEVCQYESSPDAHFIVDRHPAAANVWIAGAGNAEGFKFGPVIGEYVARRVLGKDLEPELAEGFKIPKETYDDVVAAGAGQGDD